MTPAGFTAQLARYVADGPVDALPEHAVEAACELFLDTVGVSFAGAPEPGSRIAREVALELGGNPQAVVLGTRTRTSVTNAALLNGTSAHALDLDDSHHPGYLHPSAVLVPAVLALAEHRGVDGRRAIAAYLYGLDTIAAVGQTINLRHYELGWHATATIGTLAAAAAGAKLVGLSPADTTTALALAASQAGGVRRNFGSMTKPFHAGRAASAGLLAVLLAERGFTAGEAVLEGERGLFDLIAGPGEWDTSTALGTLDHSFSVAVEGLGIKRFASCGVTHAPIEAALELRAVHAVRPEDVAALELVVNPLATQIATYDDPRTGLEAKFSLPQCVALAFVRGAAGLAEFTDELASAEQLRSLRRRVRITTDPTVGLTGHMSFGCRLTARLADGRALTTAVEMARGKWVGERLTHEEVVRKYDGCMNAGGVGEAAALHCRELLESLVELPDLRELAAALHTAATTP
jgi:2-methylcitrate dehydratase PrpD